MRIVERKNAFVVFLLEIEVAKLFPLFAFIPGRIVELKHAFFHAIELMGRTAFPAAAIIVALLLFGAPIAAGTIRRRATTRRGTET